MPKKFFKKVGKGLGKAVKSVAGDVFSAVKSGNFDPASIATSVIKKNIKRVAKKVGIADHIGDHAAHKLAGNMESIIHKIKGNGDYITSAADVDHNVLIHGSHGTAKPIPQFSAKSMRDGRSMMIAHREFIGDVSGSTAYAFRRFATDPTATLTFPWLSTISPLFQKYRFHGLVFEFVSTSSNALNSTNTALGTVIMTHQTNALAAPFANKVTQENTFGAISCKPAESIVCGCECSPALNINPSYIRHSNDNNANFDIRLNQGYGFMQYGFVGMQAVNTIGEAWVSYMIELIDPILNQSTSSILPVAHFSLNNTVTDGFSTGLIFGDGGTELVNSMGVIVTGASNVLTIPATAFEGLTAPVNIVVSYMLNGAVSGSPLTGFGGLNPPGSNVVNNNIYTSLGVADSSSQVASGGGGVGTSFFENNAWTVLDPTVDVILTYSTATCIFPVDDPITPLCGDLFVTIYTPLV